MHWCCKISYVPISKTASISLNVKYSIAIAAVEPVVSADDGAHSIVTATLKDEQHQPVEG